MSRRVRSILLIAAVAAILLAGMLPLLRGRPIEPVPPPLPSEMVKDPERAATPQQPVESRR